MPVNIVKKSALPDLGAAVTRARALGSELGDAADRLNASYTELEQTIAGLRLGVTAEVELPSESYEDFSVARKLKFGKVDKAWRLMYVSYVHGDEENTWSESPVVNTSREVRLELVSHLAPLVTKLVETAEEEAKLVRAKADEVAAVTATLKASGGAK